MRTEYLCIAIVAATWGGYPLISRSTSVAGPLGALILTLFGLVPISIAAYWDKASAKPSSIDLGKLLAAGLLMGTGTAAFNYLATSRRMDASISIPIVDTAMLVVSVLGAAMFYAEPMTARKIAGLALMVAGILVLKPA
jgi:drug/metabolite transporter (DMT)-like permease